MRLQAHGFLFGDLKGAIKMKLDELIRRLSMMRAEADDFDSPAHANALTEAIKLVEDFRSENNALASASSGDVIRCRAPDANDSACTCCQHNFRVLENRKNNALASASVPMIIWCPWCGSRHIDVGEFATKPHHTHACQNCGAVWRPAVVNTVGVQFLPGYKDALIAQVCNCGYDTDDRARHSASCNVVLKRISK